MLVERGKLLLTPTFQTIYKQKFIVVKKIIENKKLLSDIIKT